MNAYFIKIAVRVERGLDTVWIVIQLNFTSQHVYILLPGTCREGWGTYICECPPRTGGKDCSQGKHKERR